MSVLNQPYNCQMLWDNDNNAWTQTQANYLNTGIVKVEVDRWAFRGSLRASTARVTAYDPSTAVRPSKTTSLLHPNVQLGRRGRILARSSPGVYQPWFFGYATDYAPSTADDGQPTVQVTLSSPLAMLASKQLTIPPSDHPKVWDAADPYHTALWLVLREAGLWGTAFLDLDDVGATVIDGIWGNGTKALSEWLSELCTAAGCIVADEPRYALSTTEVDWVLRWYRPSPLATPTWHWAASDGELEATPSIQFNGDLAA